MSDDLVYLSREPLNAEVRLERVTADRTPRGQHYVRDHFAIPDAPDQVEIDGAVEAPLRLGVDDLRAMPSRTIVVTLECAGNGRAYLEPSAPGEQWHLGAVGTAAWTGVPLRLVLDRARPRRDAAEVLLVGADRGVPKDLGREIAFERSLPIDDAISDDPILAYEMDGAPLPREHGAPLRLVMPRWYGMASVKWLRRISVLTKPFEGFFQKDRYVVEGHPLREMAPRSVITAPADGARLPRAPFTVRGRVWCGRAPVDLVEVSWDRGYSWHKATLESLPSPFAWRPWSISVDPGELSELSILAYATTVDGEQQPTRQRFNRLGYMNNAARAVRVHID